ncbi:DUF6993 domain-containing protein [Micromonospora sp. DT81.3]|uniref:DUF6993 domain-containing protein n=1 Tax=Micromonospora sp. DT81.3 TaxID=3416523 RepID=UPI003CEDE1DA
MTRHPRRCRSSAVVTSVTIAAALALSGCTGDPTPPPSTSSTAPQPGATNASPSTDVGPSPQPAPALQPDGSAADNLPFFAAITAAVWASDRRTEGRAYIDALAAGGFDKAAMQVTDDASTVGNPAESIQFSVLWKGECLIGQVGPATGDPVTVVAPGLEGGGCLVGETRLIDW